MIKYIVLFLFLSECLFAQIDEKKDSLINIKYLKSGKSKDVNPLSIDINNFPEINLILDLPIPNAENARPENIQVMQDKKLQHIKSIEPISIKNKMPVDFVFVLDKTGSMGDNIEQVKRNIKAFVQSVMNRGIDYRLGLITFSDSIEMVYKPTTSVYDFIQYLNPIQASGGFDFPENALEALYKAYTYDFRENAKRVVILITDATYHSRGENGDGKTNFILKDIIDTSVAYHIKNFPIVQKMFTQYDTLARSTGGSSFNILENFGSILDSLNELITKLYAIKYDYQEEDIPDTIKIDLLDKLSGKIILSQKISLIEKNRKIVINNHILFEFNKYQINTKYDSTCERINKLLKMRPSIEISIEGHTDDIGSDEYNQKLSEQRSESLKEYLVKRGIAEERIKTIGYGKSRPIAPNDTEEGRKMNRRIEIVITKK
jgi:outer membrane protein OmpA-like peptidoglycan-associated protein/Mg-chelatase subunit ChlD